MSVTSIWPGSGEVSCRAEHIFSGEPFLTSAPQGWEFTAFNRAPVHARIDKIHHYYGALFGVEVADRSFLTTVDALLRLLCERERDFVVPFTEQRLLTRCRWIAGANPSRLPLYWPRLRASGFSASCGATAEVFGPPYWWLGSSPGGLHIDRVDTLLTQLQGTKHVAIWPDYAWEDLYPNDSASMMPRHSQVGPWHLCREVLSLRFPRALRHSPVVASLSSGRSLYIPARWPHAVVADAKSVSVTHSRAVEHRLQGLPSRRESHAE